MRETHRASLTRPLGRAGEGPLPTGRTGGGFPIFFNTEDTDLTEREFNKQVQIWLSTNSPWID